jgi:hypothetical protein
MVKKGETALTSQLPSLVLQLLARLPPGLQRTGAILVEPIPLFSEAPNLLLQT